MLCCIACPSGSFEVLKFPAQRSGRFSRRASCPMASDPMAGSGVPKVGEPDFRLIEEKKLARIAGDPGRTSCVSAQEAMLSASPCATIPAMVRGATAPPSRKGRWIDPWLAAA